MANSMQATLAAKFFDRDRSMRIIDGLAVALAVSLPWSTSATGILVVLWLIALVPTLDAAGLRRELLTPAGGLPVVLWALGVAGMSWADVPLVERLQGLDSFHKLLLIPLMIFHFRRSGHVAWVVTGFMLSCGALLVVSSAPLLLPFDFWPARMATGVPVKDHLSQSAMFTIAIAIAIDRALDAWRNARLNSSLGWMLLALAFVADIFFVATSRTALIVLLVLLILFGLKRLNWKGAIGAVAALIVAALVAWPLSSSLRSRISTIVGEVESYRAENARTSAGERLEFWTKSLRFMADAPMIGHGTGSIPELFRRAATPGETSSIVATNPHNQTFAVAIQLGLVGTVVLFAMWIAHILLFRGPGLAAWVGFAVVVQNFVGSLFNSHLFDFTHGWGYVIGVGIAGGIVAAINGPDGNKIAAQERGKVGVP